MSRRWFRRLLCMCPTAIAILWVAGVAHIRDHVMSPQQWAMVVAGAIGLAAIARHLQRARPMPPVPTGANPLTISALAAAILGFVVFLGGGMLEVAAENVAPSGKPWLLRTSWHAMCAFAASYCALVEGFTRTGGRRKAN